MLWNNPETVQFLLALIIEQSFLHLHPLSLSLLKETFQSTDILI